MPIYSIEWEYNTTTTKGLTMKYNEEEPMGYDELVNWLSENHYEVFCQWAQIVEE